MLLVLGFRAQGLGFRGLGFRAYGCKVVLKVVNIFASLKDIQVSKTMVHRSLGRAKRRGLSKGSRGNTEYIIRGVCRAFMGYVRL